MFKVYLINHSHIDIGYTERQERITEYHGDFLRQAVDCALSPARASYEEKSKFHYTLEGFWEVEEYLKRYGSEGEERLLRAIRMGAIELTAGYLHLAELLNYENLSHTLDYTQAFVKKHSLEPVITALSCDVNGFSWGFADALAHHGVRHLCTCINTHHGDSPFSKPMVPFWWESPQGKKILTWNGLAYHKGNVLGLMPPIAPGGDPGVPGMLPENSPYVMVDGPDYAYQKISQMIEALKKDGYAYDFLPVMGSGLYTDNSPVSDDYCSLLQAFNEKYGEEIQVISAPLKDFFTELSAYGESIPTYRGDWNDWWTDGVISTPNETRLFRNAQRIQSLIQKVDPEQRVITPQEHEEISNLLIRYSEHTWGHSASWSSPYDLAVAQLDTRKGMLAIQADTLAGAAYDKLAHSLGDGEFAVRRPFSYHVKNPSGERRTDIACFPVDFWEEGFFDKKKIRLLDEAGREYETQPTGALRGFALSAAVTLEPGENRRFHLEMEDGEPFTPTEISHKGFFENEFYRLAWGEEGVSSLLYKATGEELITPEKGCLGQPIYQLFPKGVRQDAAGFGYAARKKPADVIYSPSSSQVEVIADGPVYTRLRVTYTIEGAAHYALIFTLYRDLPKFQMTVELAKSLVLDPEGMYVTLPFALEQGEWYLDKAGAFFRPGEQLPHGCTDYYSVCRGAVLSGKRTQLSINTLDTPLLTINGLKLWDHTPEADTSGPVYSWLTNNKWETNFRVQCAGCLQSRYIIEPGAPTLSPSTLEQNDLDFISTRE